MNQVIATRHLAASLVSKTVAGRTGRTGQRLVLLGCEPVKETIHADHLELDHHKKQAFWRGKNLSLTYSEFRILARLLVDAGVYVSYRRIYDVVRGVGFHVGDGHHGHRNAARVHIKRIRRKFRAIDSTFDKIQTRYAFGYRWVLDE